MQQQQRDVLFSCRRDTFASDVIPTRMEIQLELMAFCLPTDTCISTWIPNESLLINTLFVAFYDSRPQKTVIFMLLSPALPEETSILLGHSEDTFSFGRNVTFGFEP